MGPTATPFVRKLGRAALNYRFDYGHGSSAGRRVSYSDRPLALTAPTSLNLHIRQLSSAHSLSRLPILPSNHSTQTVQLPRLSGRLKRAIRQQPQSLRRRLTGRDPRNIMTVLLQERDRAVIIRRLKARHTGNQLIMQPRHLQRLSRSHIAIEHVPQVLHRARDDAGAAGGSDGEVEGVVGEVLDNGGGDAGEGAFTGDDVIRRTRGVAKSIGDCTVR